MVLRFFKLGDQSLLLAFLVFQRVDGMDQLPLVKRRVGVIKDVNANMLDLAGYPKSGGKPAAK